MKKTLQLLRRPNDNLLTQPPGSVSISSYGATHKGLVRENNEDNFLVAQLDRTLTIHGCGFSENDGRKLNEDPSSHLLMVADGMGGHESGDVASAVVTDMMVSYVFSMMPWLGAASEADTEKALAEGLRQAVERSQDRMAEVAKRKGIGHGMGSTLTMGYVVWPMLYLVHVGDSRAYLSRGGELFRLTRDHSLAEKMVEQGVMTEEEASESRFSSILTNCLGGGRDNLEVELHQMELKEGDVLLLCTDGLYGEVKDTEIAARLASVTHDDFVQPCVDSLMEMAKTNGGKDNITLVISRF